MLQIAPHSHKARDLITGNLSHVLRFTHIIPPNKLFKRLSIATNGAGLQYTGINTGTFIIIAYL